MPPNKALQLTARQHAFQVISFLQREGFKGAPNKALQLTARQHVSQVVVFSSDWMLFARRS
jgi:hypothetical protein